MLFRFWQAGSGYDRNLMYGKTIPAIAEYIHANPVRRGLATSAELWPWSSARYWMGKSDVPLVPDPFQP